MRCGGRFRGLGRRRAAYYDGVETGLEAVHAALEPLEVVLEPLPRRVEVVGLQEGVATEQRIEVTEGMHDDEKDDSEVGDEKVATRDSPGDKIAQHEAREHGRMPELHAVRRVDERKQSGNEGSCRQAGILTKRIAMCVFR